MLPLIAGLGTTELLIILAVIILLFGASKLPELARGSGRALRIFKAETKGLGDDTDRLDDRYQTPEQREIRARQIDPAEADDAEREAREQAERRQHGDTTT